jgi:hypothetical protein
MDITSCLFMKQNEDCILGHQPKWEGLFVSMEIFTCWVEECICRIPKGDGSNSYRL